MKRSAPDRPRRIPPADPRRLLEMIEQGCPFSAADFPPGIPPEEAATTAHQRWAARFILDSLHHHLQMPARNQRRHRSMR